MGYALKKFVSFWLMPLPFALALLVLGLWLTRRNRRHRAGRAFLVLGTASLLLFGNTYVSMRLMRPLEQAYPAMPDLPPGTALPPGLAACRYVVVLGSGHADDPALPANSRLAPSALARITEAVRLLRRLPQAGLIVSGPPIDDGPSHAAVLAATAVSLGLDPGRIRRIESARDTEAEALAVRALVGSAPVALVTSAAHMPRAAALLRHAGVNILPCPADFIARSNRHFDWSDLLWDSDSLNRSTWAIREWLGNLWVRLRHQA